VDGSLHKAMVINISCFLNVVGIVDHCKRHSCNLNYTVCKNNPAMEDGYECLCKSCSCSTVVQGNKWCTVGKYLPSVVTLSQR